MTGYAIITKYHGPTANRGSRIIATSGKPARRVSIGYGHELNRDAEHAAARRAWIVKYAAPGSWMHRAEWATGELPDGSIAHVARLTAG